MKAPAKVHRAIRLMEWPLKTVRTRLVFMSKERHESFKLDNFLNKMIEALRTTVSNTIKISPVEAHSGRNMNLTPAQDTFSNISAKSNWIKLNRKTSVLTRKYWADHYCQRRKKETRCDSGIKRERSWLNP